jgi:predicted phosphodiesterase
MHWNYFLKWFDNIFLPYIEENNINTIIQLGDFFDNRKSLELHTIYQTKTYVLDKLKDKKIHIITGNHDLYYKDSNHINSIDLVLGEYTNINTYSECATINIGGTSIDLIPWINTSNYDNTVKFIDDTKSKIAFAHLEVNGAMLLPGHHLTHGTDPNIFSKYTKVLSGHIHFRSIYQNIHYIGIFGEMNAGDENAVRGLTVLDTTTLKTKFIRNPYKLYQTVYYEPYLTPIDLESYRDCVVKLIVKGLDGIQDFDSYVERLTSVAYSVKIVEQLVKNISDVEFTDEAISNNSTLELFEEYVQSIDIDDIDTVMSIIKNIYQKIV